MPARLEGIHYDEIMTSGSRKWNQKIPGGGKLLKHAKIDCE
jgi:hypothetical protein